MSKRMFIILTVLSIIFLSIGGTFAYYTTTSTLTNITQIKSGNLTLAIDGGGSENVNLFPSICTSEYAIKKTIVASSVNTSGGKVSFSIGMNITALSDDFKRNTMRYALTTVADSCADGLVASGTFGNASVGSDIWLIKNDYDNITQTDNTYTKTYYLYIWLAQLETQNLSGNISVNIKGTSSNNPSLTTEADRYISLYNLIKDSADTTTTIDFSKTSEATNTNGIYTTTDTDSGNSVYYYRGNVENRLIFANFCWRIIRTTETGGVKLIYDGVPSNGECNNTGSASSIGTSGFNSSENDAKYVGYMYGSSIDDTENTTDSTVKTFIDTWYSNNMTSYTAQLEDTVFCNDRSYTTSGTKLYFGSFTRLIDNNAPTLKCQNTRDKFTVSEDNGNGDLTYPVGLITADEMSYAGEKYWANNRSSYLTDLWMWTLSPNSYYKYAYCLYGLSWGLGVVSNSVYIRPVISLKSGTSITSGSGTATDPYIVN